MRTTRIKTMLICISCQVNKRMPEFSYANIWCLPEQRRCISCVRRIKIEIQLERNKKWFTNSHLLRS